MNEGWKAPGVASRTDDPGSHQPLIVAISKPIAQDPLNIYAAFFLSHFTRDPPPEGRVMLDRVHRCLGRLLSPVRPPRPDTHGDPLAHAAEALVTTYFGKLNCSPQLVHDSTVPYVRALKSVSAQLAHFQRVGIGHIEEEEVMQLVFACLFLAFWEVGSIPDSQSLCSVIVILTLFSRSKLAMSPRGTAWQKHVRGLATIIQWRGPLGFQAPLNLQVITLVRAFMASERPCWSRSSAPAVLLTRSPAPRVHLVEAANLPIPTTMANIPNLPSTIFALVSSSARQKYSSR